MNGVKKKREASREPTKLGTGGTTLFDRRQEGIRELSRNSLTERRDAVNVIHRLLVEATIQPSVAESVMLPAADVAERGLARLVEDEALASELESARSLLKENKEAVEVISASEYYVEVFLNAEYQLLLQYGVTAGGALVLVERAWALRQVAVNETSLDTKALREVASNLLNQLTKYKEIRHKDDARAWKDKSEEPG